MARFERHYRQANLSEKEALRFYKGQGSADINRFLRDARDSRAWLEDPLGEIANHILNLDTFFAKCQFEVADEFKVYRGHHASPEHLNAFESGALKEGVLLDFALWSTSLIEQEAIEFYDAHPADSFLIEIHLDKEGYGFYLDLVDDLKQYEILLPRQIVLQVEQTLMAQTVPVSRERRKIVGRVRF